MQTHSRPSAIPGYEGWPEFVQAAPCGVGPEIDSPLGQWLGVPARASSSITVREVQCRRVGSVEVRELQWSVGFGPDTTGYILRPASAGDTPLPGVLALHCHGGDKFEGARKLVDTGYPNAAGFAGYEGQAFANFTASQGATVLVHDAFGWGSRGFHLSREVPWRAATLARATLMEAAARPDGRNYPNEREAYNALAAAHEDTVAKVAGLLGTSFAGMVAFDDLVALEVLRQTGLTSDIGLVGFSGGGGRAHILAALDGNVKRVVVACMMSTFASLVPAFTDAHSWLLQTPGLARHTDWPEIAVAPVGPGGSKPQHDLLVQQALRDDLFSVTGMRDAVEKLRSQWPMHDGRRLNVEWSPVGHVMTHAMQVSAARFLLQS